MRTPAKQDKRLWLTVGVIAGVLALTAAGRPPNEQVLTFLGLMVGAFLGQSQAGQTLRERARLKAAVVPPGEP